MEQNKTQRARCKKGERWNAKLQKCVPLTEGQLKHNITVRKNRQLKKEQEKGATAVESNLPSSVEKEIIEKIISKPEKTSVSDNSEKFEALKAGITLTNGETFSLADLMEETNTSWIEPEWGFPKGRRNNQETDLDCALREFKEETEYLQNDCYY